MTTSDTAPEPAKIERPSFDDVYDNLTWHDETAIENALNLSIHDLAAAIVEQKATLKTYMATVRALELVHYRAEGLSDVEARAKVRLLTNAEVTELLEAYFAAGGDDEDSEGQQERPVTLDTNEDEDGTPAGEGDDSAG